MHGRRKLRPSSFLMQPAGLLAAGLVPGSRLCLFRLSPYDRLQSQRSVAAFGVREI